jgi:methionyl aminopeptidase
MPSVSPEVLKKLTQAGRIAGEAREFGISHVEAGGSALELANAIEALIVERGAECAFPVNIGINEVAAHYTPGRNSDVRFRQGDVVKIDVGAHVDGYPGDTAATVEVGTRNHTDLIRCAQDALTMCVEMVRPGTPIAAMGSTVARVVRSAGFRPVQNLTGHSMERYNLHAGLSIPNIESRDKAVVEEGMVLAIEPFSTSGAGKVGGRGRGNIFRVIRERKAQPEIMDLFTKMMRRFVPFPFAGRWCEALHPSPEPLVTKMYRLGMIMSYPVLTDVGKGVVAQAEHSVLVTKEGCRILTR